MRIFREKNNAKINGKMMRKNGKYAKKNHDNSAKNTEI